MRLFRFNVMCMWIGNSVSFNERCAAVYFVGLVGFKRHLESNMRPRSERRRIRLEPPALRQVTKRAHIRDRHGGHASAHAPVRGVDTVDLVIPAHGDIGPQHGADAVPPLQLAADTGPQRYIGVPAVSHERVATIQGRQALTPDQAHEDHVTQEVLEVMPCKMPAPKDGAKRQPDLP